MPKEVKWAISFLVGAGLLWVGWRVYAVLIILHIIVCFTLMIVVLLQSGEAADLAGAFGGAGSQTAFGPRGAASLLSNFTKWCAIMFMLTSTALTIHISTGGKVTGNSVLEQFSKPVQKTTAPAPATNPVPLPFPVPGAPAAPAQTPPASQTQTPQPPK
jgi:preprotein translocase subunit SecG